MSDFETFLEKCRGIDGFLIASLTDRFILDACKEGVTEDPDVILEDLEEKLLEARVFNEEREIKIFRTDISKPFRLREITTENEGHEFFDEAQYLDIDTQKKVDAKGYVRATGGGAYYLPRSLRGNIKYLRIVIRSYLARSEDGSACIRDWRLVKFTNDQE